MDTQQLHATAGSASYPGIDSEGLVIWDQKGVVIVWPDGHRSRLPWASLRDACPCAECRKRQAGRNNYHNSPAMGG
ncbi:MAG: DUF971 domain-containing protein [Deltaproteobacteria bacterium]|nr:DUF971 domain-containing protein [Deltaproteobacteria bacterium]